jgi:hypothetical protein
MRQQIKPTVERLIIGPLRDLVDTTFDLITRPASVAREFAQEDGHQFARAVTYFVAAFSAGVILENIASWSLGLETFSDLSYWIINLLGILSITVLAAFLAFVLGSPPLVVVVKSACLAYGAWILISGFLMAGATLTMAGLHKVGYIPDFTSGLASFENWEQIWTQAYFDCLREENTLFAYAYDGLGGRYERLNDPLDKISYLSVVFLIAATILFAVLAFFGMKRRRWSAAVAAVLGAVIFYAGAYLGATAWAKHLRETSPCATSAVQASEQATAEDYARMLAKSMEKETGRPTRDGVILTSVEQKGTSLIFRVRAPSHPNGVEGFVNWLTSRRLELVRIYCGSEEWARYSRKIGLTQVWVYRYADTDRVETVVQSPDQCTR